MRPEREFTLKIGEETYQLVSDDDYLETMGGDYEPPMVKLFGSLVTEDDYVLDVGANVGCTSILLGQRARRVASFEPSPSTFRFLERNVRISGLRNVVLQNCALGSAPGHAEITFAPANRSGGFVSGQTKASLGHVTEAISIARLDDMVRMLGLERVDFIKIDVEGFEQFVVDGATETLDKFRPIVVLEMNHWCLNAFQRTSVPDFLDFLRERFPILFAVEGDHYADLHDESDSYIAMYHHIIHFKYSNLVAAFSADRLSRFHQTYTHQTL